MPARRTLHVSVEEREALEDLRDHAPKPYLRERAAAFLLMSWRANACCVRAIRKPSLAG
jgi:hypothetical protein